MIKRPQYLAYILSHRLTFNFGPFFHFHVHHIKRKKNCKPDTISDDQRF